MGLWEKISQWVKFSNNFFEEGETSTMDGKKIFKTFGPNWKSWCVMDSKHNKCVPIVGWR
jgi:hypothetical protein